MQSLDSLKQKLFLNRKKLSLKTLFLIISGVMALLLLFFWKIQILNYTFYLATSRRNILKKEVLFAPRGFIKDRKGNILAENLISFDLIVPRDTILKRKEARAIEEVRWLLGLTEEKVRQSLTKKNFGTYFLVAEDIPFPRANYFFANRKAFTSIELKVKPKRLYPYKTTGSNPLGYIGAVTEEDIRKASPERPLAPEEFIGKAGLEKYYDDLLQGRNGKRVVLVDSVGIVQRVLEVDPPTQGASLNLSLDIELQSEIEALLTENQQTGSVVVMNPKNGEVLSLVSTTLFDPNLFASYFTPQQWESLIGDPSKPLINKAISGLYSPGSIFKLVIALGGLENGVTDDEKTVFCSGSKEIYNTTFRCWNPAGHGTVNLYTAIEQSCNIYFYTLGKSMEIDLIEKSAKALGLGSKTGIDLAGEKSGLVPSREWKRKAYNLDWFAGETISVAIGQGPLLVTPVQIAQMISILANRGAAPPIHLLKYSEKEGKTYYPDLTPRSVPFHRENIDKVVEGMWLVVNGPLGTARAAQIPGRDICGKTGTVQVVGRETLQQKVKDKSAQRWTTHAWFTGFAPKQDPEVVVVVMLEHSGSGGGNAAPVAKKIFELYFSRYHAKTP